MRITKKRFLLNDVQKVLAVPNSMLMNKVTPSSTKIHTHCTNEVESHL